MHSDRLPTSFGSVTAICLFSGGLDSRLAARLVADQGVRLLAVHFTSDFLPDRIPANVSGTGAAAGAMGMELRTTDITDELIALVENPPHGHGSELNPCIDCRILQLRRARSFMDRTGAAFIVTGEVLGQRPMTQRKGMMRHTENEAGVAGRVLRPLSARLLEPTLPERAGWVDRRRLCAFSGRQRTPQIRLAEQLGITNYPAPAGGCRLTDPGYARRLRDLLCHNGLCRADLALLPIGRHFRLDDNTRLIVGRDESENDMLSASARDPDVLIACTAHPGPTSLLRGESSGENLRTAARITARYGKGRDEAVVEVKAWGAKTGCWNVPPAGRNEFTPLLIAGERGGSCGAGS